MTLPLIELNLGREGLEFLLHRLEGGRTLSRHLRSEDLSTGEVLTYLPRGTTMAAAKQFEYGGKLPTPPRETWTKTEGGIVIPTPNLREHLVGLITRYLSRAGNVCLLENALASRGDRWLQKSAVNAVFLGNEVYHLLTKATTSAAVDAAVRASYTPNMFVGALSSFTLGGRAIAHRSWGAHGGSRPRRGQARLHDLRSGVRRGRVCTLAQTLRTLRRVVGRT
jgi:hypothetical protein